MNKEELIAAARKLKQPSVIAQQEYSQKRELLVARINQMMSTRLDICELVGEENLVMMQDNHANHARFIESVFSGYDPDIFVETILWVFRAYRIHGLRLTYWPAQLNSWVDVFKKELSPDTYQEIYPFYHWMIIHIPIFISLSEEMLNEDFSGGRRTK